MSTELASAPILEDEDGGSIVRSPTVPYANVIPGGAHPGRAIVIKGLILGRHQCDARRFNVDLCTGHLVSGDHTDNKALHINPRFEQGGLFSAGDTQIVLNTLVNNEWGKEDRYNNPFEEGKPFSMRILMCENYYKIEVNGKHLCDYPHRIPVRDVKTIFVNGCVTIDYLEFQPHIGGASIPVPNSAPTSVREPLEDFRIDKPTLPFSHQLNGFRPPQILKLTITPFMSARQICVDFYANKEFAFHFRVDFDSDKQKQAVIRNNTVKGVWQKEERTLGEFPFNKGVTTDLVFTAFEKCIAVDVDGFPLLKFVYRNGVVPSQIDQVAVRGDLSLMRFWLTSKA